MGKYIKYIAILIGEFIEHIYGASVITDGITLYALILACITELLNIWYNKTLKIFN